MKELEFKDQEIEQLKQEKQQQQQQQTAKHPSVGIESVSQAARSSLHGKVENLKICDHWFALLMYNTYLAAKEKKKNDKIELKMDNFVCQIQSSSLRSAVKAIKNTASLHHLGEESNEAGRGVMSSHLLRSQEVTYSCLYARALDRFIFEKEMELGAVLHQGPSRKQQSKPGSPEQADIYIAPMKSFKPGNPILQSDVKLNDFITADRESSLYSINGVSVRHNCQTWPVLLGIPGTPTYVELQIHVPVDRKMWKIVICKGSPHDEAVLCTLYAAVHYLCNAPIETRAPLESPMPFKYYSTLPKGRRAFRNTMTNTVHKAYDTNDDTFKPNYELLKAVKLPGVELENLTTDGRFVQLKYQYLEGDHKPTALKQFAGVIKALHKVHEEGYVHGDIRCENMIFSKTSDASYLIDFDLARPERHGFYPDGYNHLSMRHVDACASQPMKKEHDRFSLWKIMMSTDFVGDKEAIINLLNDLTVDLMTISTHLSI